MRRKQWCLSACDKDAAAQLAESGGLDPFLALLLTARGLTDEAEAEAFKQAVLHALGGDIPVLAAVKDRRDVPFLNAVCSEPKAALYTVTPEDREALFAELLPIVKAWRGE